MRTEARTLSEWVVDCGEHWSQERRATKIAWGRAGSGELVFIEDAGYGKACGLHCPQCGNPLIAKNHCRKVSNHFAHAVPVECTGESAIHYAAKQILVRAAASGASLELPGAGGVERARDVLHAVYEVDWKVERRPYPMGGGADEQSLNNELRVDALLWSDREPRDLAIEIFVTHRKTLTDIEKLTRLRQNAIEIDLSAVPWNADAAALEDAVLCHAPRHWLFGEVLEEAKVAARAEAKLLAESREAELQERLDVLVRAHLDSRDSVWPLEWPKLTAYATEVDAFGNELGNSESRTPRVSDRVSEWAREPQGWRCVARVNGKTPVEVIVGLDGFQPPVSSETPTLAILLCQPYDRPRPSETRLKWHNIEPWQAKLKVLAADGLKPKLTYSARGRNKTEALLAHFHGSDDAERLAIACELAKVQAPYRVGSVDPAWNVPYSLWKTLVWHYKIQRRVGREILPKQIAEDRWLCRLLGLPVRQNDGMPAEPVHRLTQRSKRLWFWLRELEQQGIVSHVGRQYFTVLKAPSEFTPWAYMKARQR